MPLNIRFEQWEDSQKNEEGFWKSQFAIDNTDQYHRNGYYRSLMEGVCSYIKDFLDSQDMGDKILLDIGSGPEGILHVLEAKEKYAIDPLMNNYEKMGYKIYDNNVTSIHGSAEDLCGYENKFDIIFCLNAIDHFCDIDKSISNINSSLKIDGFLILMTDLRKKNELDCYHKMSLSVSEISKILEDNNFTIDRQMEFNHGAGNPIKQWCVICQK